MKQLFFFLTLAILFLTSCEEQKVLQNTQPQQDVIDTASLVPLTQDLLMEYQTSVKGMKHCQLYIGPDGFDLDKKIDSSVILRTKASIDHISIKPFTPVIYLGMDTLKNKTVRFKIDLGYVSTPSGKIVYRKIHLIFGPRLKDPDDPEHAYILYVNTNGKDENNEDQYVIKINEDIFNITFTGNDFPVLYVDPKKLENNGDTLILKGHRLSQ